MNDCFNQKTYWEKLLIFKKFIRIVRTIGSFLISQVDQKLSDRFERLKSKWKTTLDFSFKNLKTNETLEYNERLTKTCVYKSRFGQGQVIKIVESERNH